LRATRTDWKGVFGAAQGSQNFSKGDGSNKDRPGRSPLSEKKEGLREERGKPLKPTCTCGHEGRGVRIVRCSPHCGGVGPLHGCSRRLPRWEDVRLNQQALIGGIVRLLQKNQKDLGAGRTENIDQGSKRATKAGEKERRWGGKKKEKCPSEKAGWASP